MSDNKDNHEGHETFQGILTMIDMVNFTPQSNRVGDKNFGEYFDYFVERVTEISGERGFRLLETQGDSAVIFSDGPDGLKGIGKKHWNSLHGGSWVSRLKGMKRKRNGCPRTGGGCSRRP